MTRYLITRFLSVIPVLFGVSIAVFLLVKLVPGDLATALLGSQAQPRDVEELRRQLGLTEPLPVQFGLWLGRAVTGNLGYSLRQRSLVTELLATRLQHTLILTAAAMTVTIVIGVGAGVVSATRRKSMWDRLVMLGALFGTSMPTFWLGLLLILVFSVSLRWLPTGGMFSLREGPSPTELLRHLILPATTLGLVSAGIVARLTRSSMLETLDQDYVRTARAKGLAERRVIWGHTLKNAALPVLTVLGAQLGFMLGGAVLTETVFAWPGIGLLIYEAIGVRDLPVIQGATLLVAVAFTLVNLATDLAYGYIDPRIRYG